MAINVEVIQQVTTVEVVQDQTTVDVATSGVQGAPGSPGVPPTSFSATPTWRAPRGQQNSTIAAYLNGLMVLYPFSLPEACSLDGLGTDFTGAGSGASVQHVIYNDNGNFFPSTLVKATSILAISGTGFRGETFAPVNVLAGNYWIGYLILFTTTTPTARRADSAYWPWSTMAYGTGSTPSYATGNDGTVVYQTGLATAPATFAGTMAGNSNAPYQPPWIIGRWAGA